MQYKKQDIIYPFIKLVWVLVNGSALCQSNDVMKHPIPLYETKRSAYYQKVS